MSGLSAYLELGLVPLCSSLLGGYAMLVLFGILFVVVHGG